MALGTMIAGGVGLYNMWKGNQAANAAVANQASEGELRNAFSGSQGLIDRMTNWNQYSGGASDMATAQGNQGVQTAMQLGLGGSQANAIRNRLKSSGINQAYSNFTKGMGSALTAQSNIDNSIFGRLNHQRNNLFDLRKSQAEAQMNIGRGLLPEDGIGGLLDIGMAQFGIKK